MAATEVKLCTECAFEFRPPYASPRCVNKECLRDGESRAVGYIITTRARMNEELCSAEGRYYKKPWWRIW